jgi:uncharacterized membrane protein
MSLKYAKSPKRPAWWRRPINKRKLGIFGTRSGVTLLIAFIAILVENPSVILVLLAVAAAGLLTALAIRHSNLHEPPSLFGSRHE